MALRSLDAALLLACCMLLDMHKMVTTLQNDCAALLILLPAGCRATERRLAGVGLGSMTWRVLGLMVAKGLLDNVLSDYLWARSILLLGTCMPCLHACRTVYSRCSGCWRHA